MFFNSIDFAIFLPIVFILYWFVANRNLKLQNSLIVLASYTFYGWWDWRFLFLILLSTIIDYSIGVALLKQDKGSKRKQLLWMSLALNLGFLGFFKYYNFFAENFAHAFTFFGQEIDTWTLDIILPVGISFYTFQTLSYTIDVYNRKLKPTTDFISFAAFVSFFPQLVAGPIERASNLLPQFYKERKFNYSNVIDGLRQMLWGLFKKIVIADNCGVYANEIFNNYGDYSGSTLALGATLFTIQIYGDFSGYSDIAIGTSRLFGFELKQNFAFPFFARNIAEFWRRWHISLTTWFKDYIYIPLGGGRVGLSKKIRNTFVIFLVSGLWHGANWTYIFYGFLNGAYFLPMLLRKKKKSKLTTVIAQDKLFPSALEFFQMVNTFAITALAFIFFRSKDMGSAFEYLGSILSKTILEVPHFNGDFSALKLLFLIPFFFAIEWINREQQYGIEKFGLHWNKYIRWSFYSFIIFLIGMFYPTEETAFIYFQF